MKLAQFNFQKLSQKDLDTLQHISLLTFRATYEHLNDPLVFQSYIDQAFHKTKLEEELLNANSAYYFLKKGGEVAGYFKLNFAKADGDIPEASSVELERIYVLPFFQGQGLGAMIINKAVAITKQKGFQWLWLGVWDQNHKAIGFYEKQGFQRYGQHIFWMGEEEQNDWLMRKDVLTV